MIPGSANPLLMAAAQDTGYNVSRSLRFNAPDSAYLSRTPGSAGNRKTWTWSGWAKFPTQTSNNNEGGLFVGYNSNTNRTQLFITGNMTLRFLAGGSGGDLSTAAVFRDPSAWYHIVATLDTTAATTFRLYVNGVEQTLSGTYPGANSEPFVNATNVHYLGAMNFSGVVSFFNGYLANVEFVDGSALTASSFGETNATTGQWVPKAYTGSYGTNGFRLDFSDNSGVTATTLGKDRAGSNNWTPNNFSVTAGAGNDSLVDTPTSYGTDDGLGGSVRGNYCTWNPLVSTNSTSNGNLDCSGFGTGACGTIGGLGKYYFECTSGSSGSGVHIGVVDISIVTSSVLATSSGGWLLYRGDGRVFDSVSQLQTGLAGYTAGDVIGIAFDTGANTVQFYRNGSALGTALTLVSGKAYTPFVHSSGSISYTLNCGQRPFAYTAPSGFKALCDTNLPTPTIALPSTAMDVVTYTGTGATLTPTSSLGFSPDLVWIKSRSAATDNTIYDAVRGAQARLESNNTDAEVTSDGGLTAFNSNGFTLGTLAQVNTNAATYVAWCWDEATADGFDIVTYTGNGANRTIAHSLGVAPSFMIIKQRTAASTTNWAVWHSSLANTEYLLLNSTAAKATGATYWNSTSPTGSVFSLGTSTDVNANNGTYVAYLWSAVANFSAFGSYIGTGSADGPFVYTGFRPRWIMIKSATSSSNANWIIRDTARSSYNAAEAALFPNLSNSEIAAYTMDILSNGFKPRTTNSEHNESGQTYIYAAFAESPFQYARAR